MATRSGKQELAIQLVLVAVQDWRAAHDTLVGQRRNVHLALKRAVAAGVSQSDLARAIGWPRQRVNEILNAE